jgi:hypothetical protein
MFEERTIIYFNPFYFKSGNTAKPKYFIVLKNIDNKIVIASLPTRKDSIPQNYLKDYGCIELPSFNFNCFVIPSEIEVTECGKPFDFMTYLYGQQIDDYTINYLSTLYQNEGSDYIIFGKVKIEIFDEMITCFKHSNSTKRKYKKMLDG